MGKADPAAVIMGNDGKWHAVETTAGFHNKPIKANATPTSGLYGLPSNADLAVDRKTVADLETTLTRLKRTAEELKGADTDQQVALRTAILEKTEKTAKELTKARETLGAHVLGVDPKEVNYIAYVSGIKPGMINIIGMPDKRSPGGGHAPVPDKDGIVFKPGKPSAIWIDRDQLDDPARAASILFHETEHRTDYELAQKWVGNFLGEPKREWFGKPGMPIFQKWMQDQTKTKPQQRISEADAQLVVDEALDATATTEARANVHTFLAILQAGDGPAAIKDLESYAKKLLPGEGYADPTRPDKNPVVAALTQELKTAYRQMPKDMRAQFDAAFAAARKANPGAWISGIDYKK